MSEQRVSILKLSYLDCNVEMQSNGSPEKG